MDEKYVHFEEWEGRYNTSRFFRPTVRFYPTLSNLEVLFYVFIIFLPKLSAITFYFLNFFAQFLFYYFLYLFFHPFINFYLHSFIDFFHYLINNFTFENILGLIIPVHSK